MDVLYISLCCTKGCMVRLISTSPRTLERRSVLLLVNGRVFFEVLFQEKTHGVSALQETSSFFCC